MKKGLLLLALPALLMLNGCVIVAGGEGFEWDSDHDGWEHRQRDNRQTLSRLDIGESRTAVIEKMGEPDFSESFAHNEKAYQVYYYRTHRNKGDGKTTKDETTPVVFVGDALVGWGDKALDQAMDIKD